VYSCHLFLISSVSHKSLPFLSFIMPIFSWNIPLVPPILVKKSLVFPIIIFPSISLHCSFKKVFIFWNFAFNWIYLSLSPLPFTSLLFSESYFAFLHFFFFGVVLVTACCSRLWTSLHSSSGNLSTTLIDTHGDKQRHTQWEIDTQWDRDTQKYWGRHTCTER